MEITKNNFAENYDNIVKDVKSCCFIGFDAEFTAILSSDCFKHRLFDTNKERYDQMKTEVSKMIMTQVGLTMFRYVREDSTYVAKGYTFHLCPQVFADVDQSFIFQASTLKFLCRHKFDFNKFTYEGLPYLSKAEEKSVREHLKNDTLFTNLTRSLDIDEEKLLQQHCSQVSKWLSANEEETIYIDLDSPVLRYIIHNELRQRFPDVLTTNSLGNSNKILVYRSKDVEGAVSASKTTLENDLMDNLLGFSRILSLLEQHQKPIIGHNCFLDILLLHNQFIGPLPNKYSDFKKNVNKMLPFVYDTKFISHEMSKKLSFDEVWKSNALQDLYEFFKQEKCKRLGKGYGLVKAAQIFNGNKTYHEAGWDSYCSGYCFIRLTHWVSSEASGRHRALVPAEALAALAAYANKVNVIRAAVPYMYLDGEDPPKHRPSLLHIRSLRESTIDVGKVASLLATCGSIDIKPYGARTALIASGTQHTAEKILRQFRGSREYRVSTFNAYRHSTKRRIALWGGALLTGSLVLIYLHNKVK